MTRASVLNTTIGLSSVIKIYLEHELISASTALNRVTALANTRSPSDSWRNVLHSAELLVKFISNCLACGGRFALSQWGLLALTAVGRAEESFRCAIAAARQEGRPAFKQYKSLHTLNFYAARLTESRLVSTMCDGDGDIADLWEKAACLCDSACASQLAIDFAPSAAPENVSLYTNHMKAAKDKEGRELWQRVLWYGRAAWACSAVRGLLDQCRNCFLVNSILAHCDAYGEKARLLESLAEDGAEVMRSRDRFLLDFADHPVLRKLVNKISEYSLSSFEQDVCTSMSQQSFALWTSMRAKHNPSFRYKEYTAHCLAIATALEELLKLPTTVFAAANRQWSPGNGLDAVLMTVLASPLLNAPEGDQEAEAQRLLQLIADCSAKRTPKPARWDPALFYATQAAKLDVTRGPAYEIAVTCWLAAKEHYLSSLALESADDSVEATTAALDNNANAGPSTLAARARQVSHDYAHLAEGTCADAVQYAENAAKAKLMHRASASAWAQASELMLDACNVGRKKIESAATREPTEPVAVADAGIAVSPQGADYERCAARFVRLAEGLERAEHPTTLAVWKAAAELDLMKLNLDILQNDASARQTVMCEKCVKLLMDVSRCLARRALPQCLQNLAPPSPQVKQFLPPSSEVLEWASASAVQVARIFQQLDFARPRTIIICIYLRFTADRIMAALVPATAAELAEYRSEADLALFAAKMHSENVNALPGAMAGQLHQLQRNLKLLRSGSAVFTSSLDVQQACAAIVSSFVAEMAQVGCTPPLNEIIAPPVPTSPLPAKFAEIVAACVKACVTIARYTATAFEYEEVHPESCKFYSQAVRSQMRFIDCQFLLLEVVATVTSKNSKRIFSASRNAELTNQSSVWYVSAAEASLAGRADVASLWGKAAEFKAMERLNDPYQHFKVFGRTVDERIMFMDETAEKYASAAACLSGGEAALANAWIAAAEAASVLLTSSATEHQQPLLWESKWLQAKAKCLAQAAQALERGPFHQEEVALCGEMASQYDILEECRLVRVRTDHSHANAEVAAKFAAAKARVEALSERCAIISAGCGGNKRKLST